MKFDTVNKPVHYTVGNDIECIENIKQSLGLVGFKTFYNGNVLKYQHRHAYKGKPVEYMQKAQWYLDRMVETRKESPNSVLLSKAV